MPGLFGFVDPHNTDLPFQIERMAKALRTSDGLIGEHWIDNEAGVGLGRESLGFFSPKPQPIRRPSSNAILFMEGELYDRDQLRRVLSQSGYPAEAVSEPELALMMYEWKGKTGISRLNGAFLLAIWDAKQRKLIVANDRFGLRVLYYFYLPGRLAFASEIKAILALDTVPRRLDSGGVADFFAFSYVLGDKTWFEDIRVLPPGTVLSFHEGKLTLQKYWDFAYQQPRNPGQEGDYVEELIRLLERAIRRRINRGLQIGLPLSGGLDSRTLLAFATERLGISLPTYTYGLPDSRDMRRGKRVARVAGVPHHPLILEKEYLSKNAAETVERTEGLQNCIESHGLRLNAMVETCQVMMLGNPGGALLNSRRSAIPELRKLEEDIVPPVFNALCDLFKEDATQELFCESYLPEVKGKAIKSLRETLNEVDSDSVDDVLDSHRLRHTVQRTSPHGRLTISHHMEFTEPYFDYELVEFALQLPLKLRWKRKLHRSVLAKVSPRLARIAGAYPKKKPGMVVKQYRRGISKAKTMLIRSGLLNQMPAHRPSSTFTDLHPLLRTVNRKWVEDILLNPRTLQRGYFRREAVRRIIDDHMNNGRDLGLKLGALITFELWHRRFMD